ncbi:TRAP transporter small permease [Devosia faecipullorum]|uniref:TRAP transporter small permease n=1 Tax=Devosia faecipullorum TaxID=2755039 RepID=UPI00187B61C0|nr:TRAP transporter small permease [Devosia faecipullorum]MBE7733320.1 TRAP transporter small permease [Devosia faecipullorum]
MNKSLTKGAELIASVLLAVVFVIFVAAVFMRYVLHMPLPWADELSVILFSILIFFASALAVKPSEQIRFEVVYELLPPPVARFVSIVASLVFGGIFLVAVWPCLDYTIFMLRQRTPALNIPYFYVFVTFPFFLLVVGVKMVLSGLRIALGHEQPE